MTKLSPVLQRAIEKALIANPDATVDEVIHDIGSAAADRKIRAEIQAAWLRASILMADLEGGEHTAEEVFSELTDIINHEAAKAKTVG